MNENQKFIKECFLKLVEMGKIDDDDFEPSTITDEELDDLQKKYNIIFPQFYRDFLKTYFYEFEELYGVVDDEIAGYTKQYVEILPNKNDGLKYLVADWDEDNKLGLQLMANGYIHIGTWGGSWGPLCIDTHKSIENIDYDDYSTWSLVWFEFDEFFGGETLEDYIEAAQPAAPDLKELMEWYFLGKYSDECDDEEDDDE